MLVLLLLLLVATVAAAAAAAGRSNVLCTSPLSVSWGMGTGCCCCWAAAARTAGRCSQHPPACLSQQHCSSSAAEPTERACARLCAMRVVCFVFLSRVRGAYSHVHADLIADDLRPEMAGPYAQKQAITPNIDAFAASAGAITFSNAYCQQAVCGPSRNSFMSGRRPHHTNVMGTRTGSDFRISGTDAAGLPGANWTTCPEHFKKNGFTTLGGGKT
jgi:hypothetical protein